jgi:ABC-type sulfate transport system permease subunit
MENFAQYFLANAYTGVSPVMNTSSAVCTVNGQPADCGPLGLIFAAFGVFMIVFFVLIAFIIASTWKVFRKAGQPGWASIIPVYNVVVMLHIVKKPIWWVVLMFVPFVNIVVGIMVIHNLSKAFGKGVGFTIGMIFLPFIFLPILGFGKATYQFPISPLDQGIGVPPTNTQTV